MLVCLERCEILGDLLVAACNEHAELVDDSNLGQFSYTLLMLVNVTQDKQYT